METWLPAPRLKQPYDAPEIGPIAPTAPVTVEKRVVRDEPGGASARALQQRLAQAIEDDQAPAEPGSWPGALKVAVLVGASILLWGAIWATARSLLG